MEIVLEVIAEHLQTNRRLVVPNFGAFVVKESGERLFSDLLRTDDGVLTSLLRNKGLTEMETAVVTDRFIFEVRHELEQYGYCRLGEIGTLRVEPATRTLRLYPPVQGEMPKQTPYIPKPIVETENEKVATKEQDTESSERPSTPITPIAPKKAVQPRKKFDFVMIVAVVILVVALLGIGYGWYVSNLGTADDDAAMDALRITPGQIVNE
jgi:nucleoid DNA-binding protein